MFRDGIEELFGPLQIGAGTEAMVLSAFFDESERTYANRPFAVAGYVFKPTSYKQFSRRWRVILRNAGVPALHMTDLVQGREAVSGQSLPQRAATLQAAVDAVNHHISAAIGVVVLQEEFESLAPPDYPIQHGSIYTALCQLCIRFTATWMSGRKKYEPVAYFFEAGHKYGHEANAVMNAWRDAPSDIRYHSHSFVEKERSYGLQAADLLAWCCTKEQAMARAGEKFDERLFTIAKRTILEPHRSFVRVLSKDSLAHYFKEMSAHAPSGQRIFVGPRKRGFR